ncbi:hypothetical protein ADL06_13740, partial [Streptomyces sp. NRRL F-6491]
PPEAGDAALRGNTLEFLAYKTLPDDRRTAVAFAPDCSVWIDPPEPRITAARCWTKLRHPLRAVPPLADSPGEVERANPLLARRSFNGTDVRSLLTGLPAEQVQ